MRTTAAVNRVASSTIAWLRITPISAASCRSAQPSSARAAASIRHTAATRAQSDAVVSRGVIRPSDMAGFLDYAIERAPERGEFTPSWPVEEIRLDEVVHRYPGKDTPAVAGVSLTVRRGEILAVVGENGSGKSTLTRLLAAIFLADKGSVSWNGRDVAAIDPDRLWDLSALVPQNFAQWPLSVRDNITLGQPREVGDDLVWQALEEVGLREAVEEFPDGLDTLLARELWGGTELSGGQWQRLACARALYRRSSLLILDEPTSQMDARGEHTILEEIKTIAADRITIVVTHQLVNTRIADRIIVMEHGRIAEHGTYDELAAGGGLFAELLALSHDR